MQDAAFAARLATMAACGISAVIAVFVTANAEDRAVPNYEAQAQCIAEYNYTHPRTDMMTNLEAALKECR